MATQKNLRIQPAVAPRLPTAPVLYEQRYQDQLNDILRLFFNQIGNAMVSVLGTNGGVYIECPNGLFFDTQTHALALANTGYPITFNQTYLSNSVSIVDTSKITVATGGVYNFQYSAQITSTNSNTKDVWIWLSRNGTDIGYSMHAYSISGSGTNLAIEWNFNIDVEAGDYVQIKWGASNATVSLTAIAASAPHPGSASSVLAVNFIAPLPDTLPTPP